MSIQLRRDPFARATLIRDLVPKRDREACWNCGGRPGRFRYRWEGDSVMRPRTQIGEGYCSIGCWEDYWEGS